MTLISRTFLVIRILVKVFPVSTVEPAQRFTGLTTTDVSANKSSLVKSARTATLIFH